MNIAMDLIAAFLIALIIVIIAVNAYLVIKRRERAGKNSPFITRSLRETEDSLITIGHWLRTGRSHPGRHRNNNVKAQWRKSKSLGTRRLTA